MGKDPQVFWFQEHFWEHSTDRLRYFFLAKPLDSPDSYQIQVLKPIQPRDVLSLIPNRFIGANRLLTLAEHEEKYLKRSKLNSPKELSELVPRGYKLFGNIPTSYEENAGRKIAQAVKILAPDHQRKFLRVTIWFCRFFHRFLGVNSLLTQFEPRPPETGYG